MNADNEYTKDEKQFSLTSINVNVDIKFWVKFLVRIYAGIYHCCVADTPTKQHCIPRLSHIAHLEFPF